MVKTRGRKKNYLPICAAAVVAAAAVFLLLVRPPGKIVPPPPVKEKKGAPPVEKEEVYRIAVIIDDVGYPSARLSEYLEFGGKLTFSVLPDLEMSGEYARLLHDGGFEVMIHIPMEPISYPKTDPGPLAILTGDTQLDVEYKLGRMAAENPHAVGANNHMGSKATQDRLLMRYTLDSLKERGLFFVDSLTTSGSCGYEVARERNVPAARRDVFLDNEDSFDHINGQFERLKTLAKQQTTAIGIGHITKTHTLEVLKRQLLELEKERFMLIFASEAVEN
ncbi:MAG: divergent polysaccharide deacetylase family protein [Spirochaetes bacterium]|nr:divergent polysaccharide deacetylase family protein [Spirochaetota bacterium]